MIEWGSCCVMQDLHALLVSKCCLHCLPPAEIEGLRRKLSNNLSPTNPAMQFPWDIGECAGMFWRPNFDTLFFPYLPTHITKPKEAKKLFVVPLADKAMFAVSSCVHVLYTKKQLGSLELVNRDGINAQHIRFTLRRSPSPACICMNACRSLLICAWWLCHFLSFMTMFLDMGL